MSVAPKSPDFRPGWNFVLRWTMWRASPTKPSRSSRRTSLDATWRHRTDLRMHGPGKARQDALGLTRPESQADPLAGIRLGSWTEPRRALESARQVGYGHARGKRTLGPCAHLGSSTSSSPGCL